MEKWQKPVRAPETGGGSSDEDHEESDFDRLNRIDQEAFDFDLQRETEFLNKVEWADSVTQKQLALQAIADGNGWMVRNNPFEFNAACRDKEMLLAVINDSNGLWDQDWVYCKRAHESDLDNDVAHAIVRAAQAGPTSFPKILSGSGEFHGLDSQIAHYLIEDGWREAVIKHLDNFTHLGKETFLTLWRSVEEWIEHAVEHGNAIPPTIGDRVDLLRNLDRFDGLDKKVLEKILQSPGSFNVFANLTYFPSVTHDEIAEMLVAHGYSNQLAAHIHLLTVSDKKALLKSFMDSGNGAAIVGNIEKWKDVVSIEQATDWFHKKMAQVLEKEHTIENTEHWVDEDIDEYDEFDAFRYDGAMENLQKLVQRTCAINDAYNGKIDPVLGRLMKEYETWPGSDIYQAYQALLTEGRVPQHISELGVMHGGEVGLNQLTE